MYRKLLWPPEPGLSQEVPRELLGKVLNYGPTSLDFHLYLPSKLKNVREPERAVGTGRIAWLMVFAT